MKSGGHERRRQKRFGKLCTIEYASEGQNYTGICRNLSLDGLFIKTRKPLGLEKKVEITIHLPDGSMSKLTGRVARAAKESFSLILQQAGLPSKDGMGIQLIEKDANYLNFLTSLINRP